MSREICRLRNLVSHSFTEPHGKAKSVRKSSENVNRVSGNKGIDNISVYEWSLLWTSFGFSKSTNMNGRHHSRLLQFQPASASSPNWISSRHVVDSRWLSANVCFCPNFACRRRHMQHGDDLSTGFTILPLKWWHGEAQHSPDRYHQKLVVFWYVILSVVSSFSVISSWQSFQVYKIFKIFFCCLVNRQATLPNLPGYHWLVQSAAFQGKAHKCFRLHFAWSKQA